MRPALFRVTLTAWLMSVAIPGAAIGGPFEDASAAFTRGDYATALGLLRPLAEQVWQKHSTPSGLCTTTVGVCRRTMLRR